MTGNLYDHLLAVVLMGALFVAAVAVLPNVGYVSLLSVDQQQLRNVGLSALNTILLDAGYPNNWGQGLGFEPSQVKRFGLSSSDATGLYVLDADKIMHLIENITDQWGSRPNPTGFLPPDRMRQLLGLEKYGFNLTIMAPFKVAAKDNAPPGVLSIIDYEVTVKLNDGKPIPKAVVNALVISSEKVGGSGPGEQYCLKGIEQTTSTNELGQCTVEMSLSGVISDVLMILRVTVGDINTVTTVHRRGGPPNNIADINVLGDTIFVSMPPVKPPPADNRWILSIHAYTDEGFVSIYNGTQQDMINWGRRQEWPPHTFPGLKYLDMVVLIFNFRAVEKSSGKQGIMVVGPFPNYLGSRVLSYSCGGQPSGEAITLQRVVNIAGMTYVVDFTIWRQQ